LVTGQKLGGRGILSTSSNYAVKYTKLSELYSGANCFSMWVKFLFDTYGHVDYPHTEFHPITWGSCAKLWWTDMELPKEKCITQREV